MLNKTFFLIIVFSLSACGGGGSDNVGNSNNSSNDTIQTTDSDGDGVGDNTDAFPNDASETLDTDGDGVGDNTDAFPSDASETLDTDGDGVGDNADYAPYDVLIQVQPTEIGEECRADEPYYALPAISEYRKPNPGDYIDMNVKIVAEENDQQLGDEYVGNWTYYLSDNNDIQIITPNLAPENPLTPSVSWGSFWKNDYFASSNRRRNDSAESTLEAYLYPDDGTVKEIRNGDDVYAEFDSSSENWKWGLTVLPRLEEYTTKNIVGASHGFFETNKRWLITKNISVSDTTIIMSGIGCVETFNVREDETRVMQYDNYLDALIDDGVKKINTNTVKAIHPSLGAVKEVMLIEAYSEEDSSSADAIAGVTYILNEINFYDDLPDMVNGN